MTEAIQRRLNFYIRCPFYEGFDETKCEKVFEIYAPDYREMVERNFQSMPLEQSHHDLLEALAKTLIGRSTPIWFTTGLVFSGFGDRELFPSLVCIEIGGMLGEELRWVERRKVDIDRNTTTAEIIPFAQRETVDTFLFGRSDLYKNRIVEHFSEAMRQVGNGLVAQLTKNGTRRRDFEGRVEAAVEGVVTHFRLQHDDQLRTLFANDTLDIVRHMPKPDLAAFAESLVTVSSMKRKVTVGPETVGGPVDVAVITRHEGFVWVKRKHYFDANVNPRYMWRAFKTS